MIDELITMDSTGDGLDDSLLYFNEDGSFTMYSDYDYDGNYEQMEYVSGMDYWGNPTEICIMADTDNNGVFDTGMAEKFDEYGDLIAHVEMNDYDQDKNFDMVKTYLDTTGDGLFDTVETIHSDNSDSSIVQTIDVFNDQTGNQIADVKTHVDLIDSNGSGNPDLAKVSVTDGNGQSFSYEIAYEDFTSIGNELGYITSGFETNMVEASQFDPNSSDLNMVSGNPIEDMNYWEYQGPTGRCALYAQKFVIEEAIGREVPIEELVEVAEEHGWFNEAQGTGTVSLNMDKLLDYYGVEHQMSFDNDISDLEDALKKGQDVIVGVDSGQIWYGENNNIFSPETNADHAVQVIGFDRTDSENPMVILNDSGTPNGCGELVPLDIFENAWNAGDAQMIVCKA